MASFMPFFGRFGSFRRFRQKHQSHIIHCFALFLSLYAWIELGGGLVVPKSDSEGSPNAFDPFEQYGQVTTVILYITRILVLLNIPLVVSNLSGLVFFNAFPEDPIIKNPSLPVPFICFRVVTRGDFPALVQQNVHKNVSTCHLAGLKDFIVEVVTDKSISLAPGTYMREVVVPTDYRTRSGAMFKARALQYCLEDGVNELKSDDWIVHLDEETLLTESCVKGIINFAHDGRYQFGQGLITYADQEIENLLMTLLDTVRVADDMGKVQFLLKTAHAPLLGWKGSYVVSKAGAELDVTYDNGPSSSIAEDAYFGLLAASKGYKFGFIEGNMQEKSPFTYLDFLQQRKRWLQGLLLVAHSSQIPLRYRVLFGTYVYALATSPITACNLFLQPLFPMQMNQFINLSGCFVAGMVFYMGLFGAVRSFSIQRFGRLKVAWYVLLVVLITPVKIVLELAAVLWALFTPKNKFVVVNKVASVSRDTKTLPV